jgi:hypothetical protein
MASILSDPRQPQAKLGEDAGTLTRWKIETNGSSGVLHRAMTANDNVADGAWPRIPFLGNDFVAHEKTVAGLTSSREEIARSSRNLRRGKAITIAYAISVVAVMLAWLYLLGLVAMRTTEWFLRSDAITANQLF